MNDLHTVRYLQEKSKRIYYLTLELTVDVPYDAEYTEVHNALDELRDASVRFDNALYNMTAEWKED